MTGITRIDGVRHVSELAVSGDHDPADVADQLDLPLEAVDAALVIVSASALARSVDDLGEH